jgi:hypothetical protein
MRFKPLPPSRCYPLSAYTCTICGCPTTNDAEDHWTCACSEVTASALEAGQVELPPSWMRADEADA